MFTLDQIKQGERLRRNFKEKKDNAQAEINRMIKSGPAVTIQDKTLIERMLKQIETFNDYTYGYNKEVEQVKEEYAHLIKTEHEIPMYLSKHGTAQYERANREALELKKSIARLLLPYKQFGYQVPETASLGAFTTPVTYHYNSVDSYIAKTESKLENLRNWGEEQIHQLKARGVNIPYMLSYSDDDLG